MANNRTWMVCGACGERIALLKYYPSTQWYLFAEEDDLNDWLERHHHPQLAPSDVIWGPMHFRLEYEMAPAATGEQE